MIVLATMIFVANCFGSLVVGAMIALAFYLASKARFVPLLCHWTWRILVAYMAIEVLVGLIVVVLVW